MVLGVKVCLHIHGYFPHLSVRQTDLAILYGIPTANDDGQFVIDDEVVNIFIHDLEAAIKNRLTSNDLEECEEQTENDAQNEDEHYIYNVESVSATYVLVYVWQ